MAGTKTIRLGRVARLLDDLKGGQRIANAMWQEGFDRGEEPEQQARRTGVLVGYNLAIRALKRAFPELEEGEG